MDYEKIKEHYKNTPPIPDKYDLLYLIESTKWWNKLIMLETTPEWYQYIKELEEYRKNPICKQCNGPIEARWTDNPWDAGVICRLDKWPFKQFIKGCGKEYLCTNCIYNHDCPSVKYIEKLLDGNKALYRVETKDGLFLYDRIIHPSHIQSEEFFFKFPSLCNGTLEEKEKRIHGTLVPVNYIFITDVVVYYNGDYHESIK